MVGYGGVIDVHPLAHFALQLSITIDCLRTIHLTTAIEFARTTVCHSYGVVFIDVVTESGFAVYRGEPYRIGGSLVDVDGVVVEQEF